MLEQLAISFINGKRTHVISAAFSSYMYVVKAAKTYSRTFNVDEIDYRIRILDKKGVYHG